MIAKILSWFNLIGIKVCDWFGEDCENWVIGFAGGGLVFLRSIMGVISGVLLIVLVLYKIWSRRKEGKNHELEAVNKKLDAKIKEQQLEMAIYEAHIKQAELVAAHNKAYGHVFGIDKDQDIELTRISVEKAEQVLEDAKNLSKNKKDGNVK